MIKCDLCRVEFKGPIPVLKAELSTIIQAVNREILTEDEINECVNMGLHATEEDIKKSSDDLANKLKKILEILEE